MGYPDSRHHLAVNIPVVSQHKSFIVNSTSRAGELDNSLAVLGMGAGGEVNESIACEHSQLRGRLHAMAQW